VSQLTVLEQCTSMTGPAQCGAFSSIEYGLAPGLGDRQPSNRDRLSSGPSILWFVGCESAFDQRRQ
jgi:hypothetical protein